MLYNAVQNNSCTIKQAELIVNSILEARGRVDND